MAHHLFFWAVATDLMMEVDQFASQTDEDESVESMSSDSLFVVACSCLGNYNKHPNHVDKHMFQLVLALVLSLVISLAQIALMLRLFYNNFGTYYPGFATASFGCTATSDCTDQKCKILIETTRMADHINSSDFGSFCVNYTSTASSITSSITDNDKSGGIGCCDCSSVWDPTVIPPNWHVDHIQNQECHDILCSGFLDWQLQDLWGLVPLILISVFAAVSKNLGELLLCQHILQTTEKEEMQNLGKAANFVLCSVVWMQLYVVHFFVIINTIHLILLSKDSLSFLSNAIAIIFILEADNCCAQFLFETKSRDHKIPFRKKSKLIFAKRIAFLASCFSTYIFLHAVWVNTCSRESSSFTYNTSLFLGIYQVSYPIIMHKVWFRTSELLSDTSKLLKDRLRAILRLWIDETWNNLFFKCIFQWHNALIPLWAASMISNQNWISIPSSYAGYGGDMVVFFLGTLCYSVIFWFSSALLFSTLSIFCNMLGIATMILITMIIFRPNRSLQVQSINSESTTTVQPSHAAEEQVNVTEGPCHDDIESFGDDTDKADRMSMEILASVSQWKVRNLHSDITNSELLASSDVCSSISDTKDPNDGMTVESESPQLEPHIIGNRFSEILPEPNQDETKNNLRGEVFAFNQQTDVENLCKICSKTCSVGEAMSSEYEHCNVDKLSPDLEAVSGVQSSICDMKKSTESKELDTPEAYSWKKPQNLNIKNFPNYYAFETIINIIYAGCLIIPPAFASIYLNVGNVLDFSSLAQSNGWYWLLPRFLVAGFVSWWSKLSCRCLLSKYPIDCNKEKMDCKISAGVSVAYKCFNDFEGTFKTNGTNDYMSFGRTIPFLCVHASSDYDSRTDTTFWKCDTDQGTKVDLLIFSLFFVPIVFLWSGSVYITRKYNNEIEDNCNPHCSSKLKLRTKNVLNIQYVTFTVMIMICVLFNKFYGGGECGILEDSINPQDFQGI